MKVILRKDNKIRRRLRIRRRIRGTKERPRVSVFRSNKYIYAQLIDDVVGKTLVDGQSFVKRLHKGKSKTDAAFEVGKKMADESIKKKIKEVVFDRGGYRYHGRVKRLAEGLREGGIKF